MECRVCLCSLFGGDGVCRCVNVTRGNFWIIGGADGVFHFVFIVHRARCRNMFLLAVRFLEVLRVLTFQGVGDQVGFPAQFQRSRVVDGPQCLGVVQYLRSSLSKYYFLEGVVILCPASLVHRLLIVQVRLQFIQCFFRPVCPRGFNFASILFLGLRHRVLFIERRMDLVNCV